MADIQSNIHIGIDTSDAMASIKMLQSQMSAFHTSMARGTATQLKASQQLQQSLINSINATKQFSAGIQTIKTSTESFTTALEKNKLSLGQYFKYSVAATKSFGSSFKTEMATIDKVARERVKDLQTQYIQLGRDANGAMKAIAVRPLMLDLENLQTKTAIAAQKQQILNQLLKQGSTNLLNWGKNTQWAGRQLMVGFTIPLSMAGTAAAKAYMEIEKASIQIKRVYGDLNTTAQETNNMVNQIKALAGEYTKYGIAISDTMAMAAKAAAMGKTGVDLLTQVNQASKLAALGGVDQNTALETTISLTNSFGTEVEKLSAKINFLNAVENQTVLSLEDMTIAIPKAAPIVKQLGGDVEDLAFFLTAMKEGGINASEGANALKSGLASLINPTRASSEFLAQFGVNIKQIVENDKGNLKKTVVDFASALDKIDPLNRARAIEMMFGKFQFSRISTLLQNVTKEGSQASRALELANMSSIQLAAISRKELEKLESSPMYKFQKSLADLQLKIAPIGETFLKAVTPIIEKVSDFLDGFNKMGDGFKQFVVVGAALLGGLAPVLLMVTGLIANGAANIIKLFANVKAFLNKTSSESQVLGETTNYLTSEQIKAEAVAASLDQTHSKLRQTLTSETSAVIALMEAYQKANAAMISVPASPTTIPARGKKMATGGFVSGPGTGTSDSIPAMLSDGEAVIPAKQVKKNRPLVEGLISGNVPRLAGGGILKFLLNRSRVATRMPHQLLLEMLAKGDTRYRSAFETGNGADFTKFRVGGKGMDNPYGRQIRGRAESYAFGIPYDAPASVRPTYGSVAQTNPVMRLLARLFGGLTGRQFNRVTNPMSENLDIYGDVSLLGKRGLGRRSQIFGGDLIRSNQQSSSHWMWRKQQGMQFPPMYGNSDFGVASGNIGRILGHQFGTTYQSGPATKYGTPYTSNPGIPYIEAYTKGGFDLNELSRIIVRNPELIPLIQEGLAKNGIRLPVSGPSSSSIMRRIRGYATGGMVRGPGGPKDDLVPADLSNGEAVIDAATVKKNPRIISALFAGRKINIPGYVKTNKDRFKLDFSNKERATENKSISRTDAIEAGHLDDAGVKSFKEVIANILLNAGEEAAKQAEAQMKKKFKENYKKNSYYAYTDNVVEQPADFNNEKGGGSSAAALNKFYKERGGVAFVNLGRHLAAAGVPAEEIQQILESASKSLQTSLTALGPKAKVTVEGLGKLAQSAIDEAVQHNELAQTVAKRNKQLITTVAKNEKGQASLSREGILPESYDIVRNRTANKKLAKQMFGVDLTPGKTTIMSDQLKNAGMDFKPEAIAGGIGQLKFLGGKWASQANKIIADIAVAQREADPKKLKAAIAKLEATLLKSEGQVGSTFTSLTQIEKELASKQSRRGKAAEKNTAEVEQATVTEQSVKEEVKKRGPRAKRIATAENAQVKETQALADAIAKEKDTILKGLLIKKATINQAKGDTALVDQEIAARKELIAKKKLEANAAARNAAATDINTNAELGDAGPDILVGNDDGDRTTKKGKFGRIAGKASGVAFGASMAASALSMIPGPVGEFVSSLMPAIISLSMIAPMVSSMLGSLSAGVIAALGPIAIAVAAIAVPSIILAGIINQSVADRKKELEKIKATATAFDVAGKSVKTFADLTGTSATSPTFSFNNDISSAPTKASTQLEIDTNTLLESDFFKKAGTKEEPSGLDVANKYKEIPEAQRKAFLESYAAMFSSRGFKDDAINAILSAIQKSAETKDLKITFNGKALGTGLGQQNMSQSLATFNTLDKSAKAYADLRKSKRDEVFNSQDAINAGQQATDLERSKYQNNIDYMAGGKMYVKYAQEIYNTNKNLSQQEIDRQARIKVTQDIEQKALKAGADAREKYAQVATDAFVADKNERAQYFADLKIEATNISNYAQALTSMFGSGQISQKAYTNGMNRLIGRVKNLQDEGTKLGVLKTIFSTMSPEVQALSNGLKTAAGQANLLQLAILGVKSLTSEELFSLDNPGGGYFGSTFVPADTDEKALEKARKNYQKLQKFLKDLTGGDPSDTSGGSKDDPFGDFFKALAERRKSVAAELAIRQELLKTGMNIADAEKLAADSAAQQAYMAAKTAEDKQKVINGLKEQLSLENVLLSIEQQKAKADEEAVDKQQKAIDKKKAELGIPEQEAKIGQYNDALEVLAPKEEAINKLYDERAEALDKIQNANEAIAESQQDQLSLADALSKGDIAAAARAAQDMKTKAAARQVEEQKNRLDKARQSELDALTVSVNGQLLTRKQIEEQITKIQTNLNKLQLDYISNMEIALAKLQQNATMSSQAAEVKSTTDKVLPTPSGAAQKAYANAILARDNKKSTPAQVSAASKSIDWYEKTYFGVKKAAGGHILGEGTATSDSIPAWLSNGEYVVKASAVKKLGVPFLDHLNNNAPKYADGGAVGADGVSSISQGESWASAGSPDPKRSPQRFMAWAMSWQKLTNSSGDMSRMNPLPYFTDTANGTVYNDKYQQVYAGMTIPKPQTSQSKLLAWAKNMGQKKWNLSTVNNPAGGIYRLITGWNKKRNAPGAMGEMYRSKIDRAFLALDDIYLTSQFAKYNKFADGGFVEPKNTGNSFVNILKSIFFTPLNMAKDIHKSVKNIFTGKAGGEDALNVASILPIGKGISLLGKGAIGLKNVLSATGKIAGPNVGSKLEQVALEKFITNPKFGYSTSLGMKEPLEALANRNNITAGYEMYRSLTPGELNRILKATKGGKDYVPGQVRSVAGSSDLQTLGKSASKTGEINFGGQNSYANTIAKITAMEDLAGIQNVNRFGDLSQLAQEGLLGAQTRYQLLKHIPSSDPKIPGIMHFGAYRHANGGFVAPKYFAKGGDVVPAMLTPGEFVVSQPAVKKFGVDNLRAINNGTSIGDSVYNYSLSVNMSGSNLNPNDVARTVIAQIKQIDAQRLRGNRF